MPKPSTVAVTAIVLLALAACAREPSLMNLRNDEQGPDEFAILPNDPLEIPADVAALGLPEPTPGGSNRADPDPEADVAAALGGDVTRARRDAGDLVSYAGRFGVSPAIRGVLAEEDLEFRRRNNGRLLDRVFGINVYFRAYEEMTLDQYLELDRLRRSGVRTPSAPPEQIELGD